MQLESKKKGYGTTCIAENMLVQTPNISKPLLDINKTLDSAKMTDIELYNSIMRFIQKNPDVVSYENETTQQGSYRRISSTAELSFDAFQNPSPSQPQEINPREQSESFIVNSSSSFRDFRSISFSNELNAILIDIQKQTRVYDDSRLEFNQNMYDIKKNTKILKDNIHKVNKLCTYLIENENLSDTKDISDSNKISFGLVIGICGFLSATAFFILPPPFSYVSALAAIGPISAAIIRLKSMK